MVFSSPLFLFLFLPVAFLVYSLSPRVLKNTWLLVCSLIFYAWADVSLVLLLIGSIILNYVYGLLIGNAKAQRWRNWNLAGGVLCNVGILTYFKYSNFLVDNLNRVLIESEWSAITWKTVALPLGISFFTFQAISYLVDVYRKQEPPQANPIRLALFISMFPQLVAGPIVRYGDIARQIAIRKQSLDQIAEGVRRFIIGLGKKVLIANQVGMTADLIFNLPNEQLGFSVAWLGIVCYTLQIYFDFSGYSDMAIGLGKMFGFDFLENFNYPYISRSITEFWRRWHLSLSSWFRDYLYIPLGGNRFHPLRTYCNLMIVFLLCGFWHGASWNFIVWGAFHGMLLIVERMRGKQVVNRRSAVAHVYVILMIMIGWVLFRAENLHHAATYLAAMTFMYGSHPLQASIDMFLTPGLIGVIIIGVFASCPIYPWLRQQVAELRAKLGSNRMRPISEVGFESIRLAYLLVLLIISSISLAAATHNPFIYFRF